MAIIGPVRLSRITVFAIYIVALGLTSLYGMLVLFDLDVTTLKSSKLATGTNTCAYTCKEARGDSAQIRLLERSTEPIAYVVGSSHGAKVVLPGQCVCVRAVVPAQSFDTETINQADMEEYEPVPGWPADSLIVDLVMQSSQNNAGTHDPLYLNARVTVSVDMRAVARNQNYNTRVYEGSAQLFDPGEYALDARIEFRNGQWNAEPGQFTPELHETHMRTTLVTNALVQSTVHVERDLKHPTYLQRHQNLPLCTDGAASGRWIPEKNLPASWKQWQYMHPAEDRRVWVPYHCRLRRISHAEFVFHMSRSWPSVHWYGDSNSRRTLRPIVQAGQWCHTNNSMRLDCLCNDAPKDLFPSEWYAHMPVLHWYRIHTQGVRRDEIYADLRLKEQPPTDPRPILDKDPIDNHTTYGPDYMPPGYRLRDDYFDLYYLFTRGTLDMQGRHWMRDITQEAIAPYPNADLVVFQMITWDVAFGSYSTFARSVELLARRLRNVYPHAQFVYRTGPYWCCRNAEDQQKKYSRLRFASFDAHARAVFRRVLSARIWDVSGPSSQRPPEAKRNPENMPCLSAHSRSEFVHLDNQIFINMLVNK
ncbi:hypothetical protein IW143_000303 [Coemansia sp. RSA 520]|nr:hypothetical protein GGH17_000943 [Coemansia sp. RSA 788]KAJ2168159.1 hypothetical protein GGH15_001613 [Coemansia sp. RSA 562]KAJ2176117.1 hypothetical protein GGH16_000316 [Coemansia sp. RSA 560]KAJ2190735.1 hypothetical protein EV181_000824 [Coemansia sp. RSA 532]KAJ2199184.1 hypothetical protein GGH18_000666 [Coemansia sp. RSA 530]KAJ2224941.1 hypothetical protein IW143_000303 [Coemansia sp. RSA 520]KAJ2278742.1 hypothetical protein J3F81_000331 [Coemansia sp. RSA 371]KAJ2283483.1 hyp